MLEPIWFPATFRGVDDLTVLFLAARDGDRYALTAAIRASQRDVWRLAAHLAGPNHADDVTQDTYLRAHRALPAFRGESSARTWLLSIARRTCADAVRQSTRQRRLAARIVEREGRPDRTTTAPAFDGLHALADLLQGLDDDRREAFVLTQVLGCSYAETAEIQQVAVGTVRSRIARAREELIERYRNAETG